MPALVTDRIRYLHVPKTGGTWVSQALDSAGVEFVTIDRPSKLMRGTHAGLAQTEDFADRFTIAFVRHPLDWWRSRWATRMRTAWDPEHEIDSRACSNDFEAFIEQVIENLPGHFGERLERFIGPPSQPVDFIGRFEHLADDLVRALKQAGEPFDERALRRCEPANVNDYTQLDALYPTDLAIRLAECETSVIGRFYAADPVPERLLASATPPASGRRAGSSETTPSEAR